jgi:hypothetical protein
MADNAIMEVSLPGHVIEALLRQTRIARQGVLPQASVLRAIFIRSGTDDPWNKSKGRVLSGLQQAEKLIVLLKIQVESGDGSAEVATKMEHRSL